MRYGRIPPVQCSKLDDVGDDVEGKEEDSVENDHVEEEGEQEEDNEVELRMMMLRGRTDPKTGTHSVCEPWQSKCTWTLLKSHFVPDSP